MNNNEILEKYLQTYIDQRTIRDSADTAMKDTAMLCAEKVCSASASNSEINVMKTKLIKQFEMAYLKQFNPEGYEKKKEQFESVFDIAELLVD